MAATTPPIISQVDYQQWNTWQPIYEPGTNREFRVVPGFGGMYVFDPYESNATGKISIYQNPSKVYEATEQQKKDAEKASGIAAQVAPIAGTIAGAYGVNAISNAIAGGGAAAGSGAVATPTLVGATKLGAGAAGSGAATGASTAGATGAGTGAGFASMALPVAGAALMAGNMYNYGGREILKGDIDAGNSLDTALGSNLMTGWINPTLDIFGLDSAGDLLGLGHKSTKQRQAERSNALAEKDNTYAQYLSDSANNQDLVGSLIEKGKAATPEGYKGFWDDPATEQNDYIWVNKQAPTEGFKHNAEYFNTLGAGDVMNNPWFFENFEGWGSKSMDERAKIADAALKSGTAFGNAGNIDFKADPNSLLAQETKNNSSSLLTRPALSAKVDSGASWTGEKQILPGGSIEAYQNMSREELAKKLAELMDGKTELGVSKQPSYFLK